MNVAIVGQGVVGARAAQVLRDIDITCNVVKDADHTGSCDVAILARGGEQHDDAETLIGRGISVVTTADKPEEVEELIELDEDARKEGVALVVGATAVPGLSGLLARHLAAQFDSADEIHVAVHGTGGPACARHHARHGLLLSHHRCRLRRAEETASAAWRSSGPVELRLGAH